MRTEKLPQICSLELCNTKSAALAAIGLLAAIDCKRQPHY